MSLSSLDGLSKMKPVLKTEEKNKNIKDEFNAEEANYILKGYLQDYTDAINKDQDVLDLTIVIFSGLFFSILSCSAFFLKANYDIVCSIFLYVAIIGFSISLLSVLYSCQFAIKHTAIHSRAVIKSIIYGSNYDINHKKLVGWINNISLITFSLSIVSTLLFVLINC